MADITVHNQLSAELSSPSTLTGTVTLASEIATPIAVLTDEEIVAAVAAGWR